MSWKSTVALLASFYLLFLVLGVPASWVLGFVGPLPDQVSLEGLEGTWVSGRAGAVRIDRLALGDVVWHLAPAGLFLGCLEYHLEASRPGALAGNGSVGRCLGGRNFVEGLTVQMLAEDLAPALTAGLLVPRGQFHLQLESVAWDDEAFVEAEGRLAWRGAEAGQGPAVKLGEVSVSLALDGEGIAGQVANRGGDAALAGTLNVDRSGRYQFLGRATPRQGSDVGRVLSAVASRQRDGSYTLRWSGRL